MRSTVVKGINDDFRMDLGSDIDIIADVITRGKAVDYLIYQLHLSGSELIDFFHNHGIYGKAEQAVMETNLYLITSYDW